MKNQDTIILLIASAAIFYFLKNKKTINKIQAAGLNVKQAINNSKIISPNDSFAAQYKNEQKNCQ